MRNTIIGLVAAAILIGALFALSRLYPGSLPPQEAQKPTGPTQEQMAEQASAITLGFVGSKDIGQWTVTCPPKLAPGAIDAGGANSTDTGAGEIKFVRCRASLLVRNRANTKDVVLGAVARMIDGADQLALILHTPPVSKAGVKIIIALAEKEIIGIPVVACDKKQCIAMAVLNSNVYTRVLARPKVAVVVPIQATGQRMIIPLTMLGLPQAVEAIKRAS